MVEPNLESRFVRRRKELEITQKQISDAIGISTRAISNWEQGNHPPKLNPTQFSILCRMLNCSIHELAADFEAIAAQN